MLIFLQSERCVEAEAVGDVVHIAQKPGEALGGASGPLLRRNGIARAPRVQSCIALRVLRAISLLQE